MTADLTTNPDVACANPKCGHPHDEHSRLAGCMGSDTCPCATFRQPSTPYDGGTSSGHSGTDTSHARALAEDGNGVTQARQTWVLETLGDLGAKGLTVREVRDLTGWHHGQASAALTNLHHAGRVARLTEVRDRCKVYVLPEAVGGRDTEVVGARQAKGGKRGKQVTLTPAEADSLRLLASRARNEQGPALTVYRDDLDRVCRALTARETAKPA